MAIKGLREGRDSEEYARGCAVRGVLLHKEMQVDVPDSARFGGLKPRVGSAGERWGASRDSRLWNGS